ncbi:hypothetical protein [Bifidobacterium longum]|uniref:hypothetical protein n=1 Tax=Bifidobacterium longum TaxID=216816 RepID=UPI00187A6F86|nr:hypothetical protein [Bifidobacterium longum]QOL53188.1 hypothetical protein BL1134_10545 [Bifidobacterium longum subsp. longum]
MSEAAKDTGAVLIAAFEGWNDACQAATNVVRHLVKRYESREIRHIKGLSLFGVGGSVRW